MNSFSFYMCSRMRFNTSRPVCNSEHCIKIKTDLSFCFHKSVVPKKDFEAPQRSVKIKI